VTDSAGAAIPGVTMKLAGPSSCTDTTTTNSSGAYTFRKLGAGNYTVTPCKTNCTFKQKGQAKVIAGKLLILNFTGTCK
jgi:SdrD B-like domain